MTWGRAVKLSSRGLGGVVHWRPWGGRKEKGEWSVHTHHAVCSTLSTRRYCFFTLKITLFPSLSKMKDHFLWNNFFSKKLSTSRCRAEYIYSLQDQKLLQCLWSLPSEKIMESWIFFCSSLFLSEVNGCLLCVFIWLSLSELLFFHSSKGIKCYSVDVPHVNKPRIAVFHSFPGGALCMTP